ncbi:MAG: hypothetical protein DRI61_04695 [Chloroflexi bacterium]|nr:MAG: hypothetical protein DRI61_04695 [Chloroflexota bacterium]HDN79550.1 hypothetical protein [Chloroflexota bacterium]
MKGSLEVFIVIPTYWTWRRDQLGEASGALFDHPTPVDGKSTLPRLLRSLCQVKEPPFSVLVLTATVHPDLEQAAAERVNGLIAPFRESFPIAQFSAEELKLVRKRAQELGQWDLLPFLSLRSYPGVRNCQLIIPHILGAEVIVALDDDEVIEPDYLPKALEFIGQEYRGKRVWGLGGLYLDKEGNPFLPEHPPTGNIFLDKNIFMNQAIKRLLEKPGRLARTYIAFGGNMVLHRNLFTRVPFDPAITRGEDIDYVINAHLAGFDFWFDKELTITHLPPEPYGALPYTKLLQDVYRFIYEREKLRLAAERDDVNPLPLEALNPYPGRFLQDDLTDQALEALRSKATPEMVSSYDSPEAIITAARRHTDRMAPCYFGLARVWPCLMEILGQDASLRQRLLARFGFPSVSLGKL